MSSDLQEALLTAGGAAALVAKHIDPVLLETQRRYAPLVRALPTVKWGGTVYYFNKRTALPQGGFVTDGGARPVSSSNYAQENFQIKLLQSVGAVTGYAQAVTQDVINNLRAREIEGASRGLYWDIELAIMAGASAPTAAGPYPQFDGLDVICSQVSSASTGGPGQGIGGGTIDNYGGASTWAAPTYTPWTDGVDQNVINAAGASLTLGQLDTLIDMVESNAAEPVGNAEWMFVMSPTANSRLAQLLVNQQRFVDHVEVEAGLTVPTYRGVPIIKSSFLAPRNNQMSTVTATASSTIAGALNAAYKYKITAVISRFGEILPSAEVSVTPSTQSAKLAFTPPSGPEGGVATHYKVFRTIAAGATNTETLLGYVDAAYFDTNGVQRTTSVIFDTGTALVPYDGTNLPSANCTPSQYFYTNVNMVPPSAGYQSIYLLSRDPNYIVRPYVREMQPVNVYPTTASPDSLPFAFVTDTTLAVRGPKYIGRLLNTIASLDFAIGNSSVPTSTFTTPTNPPAY